MNVQSKHWEKVYQTKSAEAVSWFQEHALRSLDIIRSIGADKSAGIIDVGGGASTLVDDLLADGFRGITGLGLSQSTLEVARSRIGAKSAPASWIPGDICSGDLTEHAYEIWHDRAVFHFGVPSFSVQ
jgi:hypothetical protein